MCQKSVPLSLPDNVKTELLTAYQDCLNDTKRMQKEMQKEMQNDYMQAIRKQNEKFLSDLSNDKGVWLSRKVFWWAFGITYGLSLLGFCIIIWSLVH